MQKKTGEEVKVTAWFVVCELDNGKLMRVTDIPNFACDPMDEHLTMLEEVNHFDKSTTKAVIEVDEDKDSDITGAPV